MNVAAPPAAAPPAALPARSPWAQALQAAALFAVDPAGSGGVLLRGAAGPAQQAWLSHLQSLLPAGTPLRRVPLRVADERLLGGLDLAATLRAGRPVVQHGLLAEADGGVLVLAMAERVSGATAARLTQAMDTGEVTLERDGAALRAPARWGLVALDEGGDDDEGVPPGLADRLAVVLETNAVRGADLRAPPPGTAMPDDVIAARGRLPGVQASDRLLQGLCSAAFALGVPSVRAPWLALRLARAAAALAGRSEVNDADAALAAALVLGPRARQLPAEPAASEMEDHASANRDDGDDAEPEQREPPTPQPSAAPVPSGEPVSQASDDAAAGPPPPSSTEPEASPNPAAAALEDQVLAAARAAIPGGLLSHLLASMASGRAMGAPGRAGRLQHGGLRGRPVGARRGERRGGARLSVIDTLRAAAPWQRLRRSEAGQLDTAVATAGPTAPALIRVRREDFHVTHFRQRSLSTTVFVVDASGSSALHRLAEAKGAVELLLADCYVRRDRVAVIAFRGAGAELLLPPTRSLARARRSLAGLPGGGGTPLAAGIDSARLLAESLLRRGETPTLVLLTDGRANIARDGAPGRPRATEDALASARLARAAGLPALLVDTAPQAQPQARALAEAMGARYLPLPHAGAGEVSRAVRAAVTAASAAASTAS